MTHRDQAERYPVVSVVIPSYRRPDLLRKAVVSLFEQDLRKEEYEILVVDSSPDDRNLEVLRELERSAPCTLRWFVKKPEGPGPARSLGVRHARGRVIAFLDSDCEAAPGWLSAGLAAFEPGIGLVQGRTAPDPRGEKGVFVWYVSVEEENHIYECCNIFYLRSALLEAGDLRPSYLPTSDHPPGGEDVDVAWRVKRNGWATRFAADALVYHAVVQISLRRWLVNEQLFIWPFLVGKFPELRAFHYGRFFYSRVQACFVLALAGCALAPLHPTALLLTLPYIAARASEPTATLGGVLRPVRVISYMPRDAMSFLLLLAGSVRFRTILL